MPSSFPRAVLLLITLRWVLPYPVLRCVSSPNGGSAVPHQPWVQCAPQGAAEELQQHLLPITPSSETNLGIWYTSACVSREEHAPIRRKSMTRPTAGSILIVTLLLVLASAAVAADTLTITARQAVVRAGPDSKQGILA